MDALQAIKGRKSYRSTFKTEPIPREDLREIVEAGFLAPSGCNLQTTKFIAVDDPELVKKLADIYGHEWAATAPAAILLLTKKVIAPSGETYYIQDFAAAAENILIAATARDMRQPGSKDSSITMARTERWHSFWVCRRI